MPLTRLLLTLAFVAASISTKAGPAAGQRLDGDVDPTVGLALSGGAAKGFAHVGVLLALERAGVRVDVISGTSMGSVVGALYAIGMSADSISGLIERVDWGNLVSDGSERERRFLHQRRFDERAVATLPIEGGIVSLPAGAIVGSNMVRLLERATWPAATVRDFRELPRPFAAVATDIESGEPVTLTEGVLSEVLRASSGIPGAFDPLELNGRLLVDGAISRNLPASDARDLGADFVICSDVSDPLESAEDLTTLVDVIDQVMTLAMRRATIEQREFCDILVRPEVLGISGFAFDRATEWIERGEAAAAEHAEAFRDLAASQRARALTGSEGFLGDSVFVGRIDVDGSSRPETVDLVRRELRLVQDAHVTPDRLASHLSDIDATGLFGLVRYRLDPEGEGTALTLNVQERPKDRLGIGLRYDDERRAALLFTTTVHNLVRYGSVVRLDLRVGEETKVGASYIRRHGITGRSEGSTTISWSQGELPVPGLPEVADIELTSASTSLGLVGGRSTFLGVALLVEWAVLDAPPATDVFLTSAVGLLDHESLDRIDFPRGGIDASARWEWGISDVVPGGGFSVLTASGKVYLPLHPRMTMDLGFDLGLGRGSDLPFHRTFHVGGAHRSVVFPSTHPLFHGLDPAESSGTAMQIARAGMRWEVRRNMFVRVGVDAGQTADEWSFPLEDGIVGAGVGLGIRTLVGPLWLEWSKATEGRESRLSISIGRVF